MPMYKCSGYIDVRVPVSCIIEADDEDEAETDARVRFECRDDLEEGDGDVNESQVEFVEEIL